MRINGNAEISFQNSRRWIQKELKQSRTKRVIDLYCKMLLGDEPLNYDKLGKLYRLDQKEPAWSIKRLLKQQEVKKMIDEKLEAYLLGEGVTPKYLIDKRKLIIDLAQDNVKLDTMLKAVEGFEDMYQMRTEKREVKTITETLNYKEMLENGTKTQLIAKRERNLNNEELNEDSVQDTLTEDKNNPIQEDF